MSWLAVVLAVVQALGPALVKWLESLIEEAGKKLEESKKAPDPQAPTESMKALFSKARGQLWWFQWARSKALDRVERVMLRRAEQLWQAILTEEVVEVIDEAELDEIGRI